MRIAKAAAVLAVAAYAALVAATPKPAGACTFTRVPGPCTLHCINGASCTGHSFCIFDSCGSGIICDGRAFNCR